MKQKYKEILKAYTSLPHIILRKKYLIPQAPIPPKKINNTSFLLSPFQAILKDLPHLVDEDLIKLQQNKESERIREIFQQQMKKKKEEYEIQYKKYEEKYLKPLKNFTKGLRPEFFYLRDNKIEVNKNGAYKSFSRLYELYKDLDEDTKRKYEEICNEQSKRLAKILAEAETKYKIPEKKFEYPYIIYLKEKYEGPIDKNMYNLYTVLPQQQKEIYRKKSRDLKEKDKIILQAFLKAKNINMEQFLYIKKICENVQEIRLELKKAKMEEESLERLSLDDDQQVDK